MEKHKTVYLAGKITGDPDYRDKFEAAALELEAAGFVVMNPAILPKGFCDKAYMRITSAMQDECDASCFLPDWPDSKGARAEYARAEGLRQYIFSYDEWKDKQKWAP